MKPPFDVPRFWCARDKAPDLEDTGFLAHLSNRLGRASETWQLAAKDDAPRLALLGEPGLGKTTEMHALERRLKAGGDQVQFVDLGLLDETRDAREAVQDAVGELARTTGRIRWLLIDALDEGLRTSERMPAIVAAAVRPLAGTSVSDPVRIRLASRGMEWSAFEKPLKDAGWDFSPLQLLPLRASDVEDVARQRLMEAGSDADTAQQRARMFLQQVSDRDLGPLAARWTTLNFLIDAFARDQKVLLGSAADLFGSGCQHLSAADRHSARHGGLRPEERVAVAARIAAVSLLCDRTSVVVDDSRPFREAHREVAARDLTGYVEPVPDREATAVSPEAIREVAGSALFASPAPGTVRWSHQSFAEYLAARWLVEHVRNDDALLDLLQSGEGELRGFVPGLQGVVGWLLAMPGRPGLFERVLADDASLVLQGDLLMLAGAQKAKLLSRLLHDAEERRWGDWIWTERSRLSGLRFDGIEGVLRPFVGDPSRHRVARRFALEVARACRVVVFKAIALSVALDRTQPRELREAALELFVRVAPASELDAVRPLLQGGTEDEHDELRAGALRALWKARRLSVADILAAAAVPSRPWVISRLAFLLPEIAKGIEEIASEDDWPLIARWAAARALTDDERAGRDNEFAATLLEHIARRLEQPAVRGALREAILATMSRPEKHERDVKALDGLIEAGGEAFRREVIDCLIQREVPTEESTTAFEVSFASRHLLVSADFDWFVAQARHAGDEAMARRWARFAVEVFWRLLPALSVDSIDGLMMLAEREALESILQPLLVAEMLDDPAVQQRRQQEAEWAARAREHDEHAANEALPVEPSMPDRRARLIRRALDDDANWWVDLLEHLILPDDTRRGAAVPWPFTADLRATPGWVAVGPSVHGDILAAAERYLRIGWRHSPAEISGSMPMYTVATVAALHALNSAAPERYRHLGVDVWERQAGSIIRVAASIDAEAAAARELLPDLWRHAPAAVAAAFSALLANSPLNGSDVAAMLAGLNGWQHSEVRDALEAGVRREGLNEDAFESALAALLRASSEAAEGVVEALIRDAPGRSIDARIAGLRALLRASHQRSRELFAALRASGREAGVRLASRFDAHRDRDGDLALLVGLLTPAEIADWFHWLVVNTPDTARAGDRRMLSADLGTEVLRGYLLDRLVALGTVESGQILETLSRHAGLEWLAIHTRRSEAAHRAKSWRPVSLRVILAFAAPAAPRPERSSRGLVFISYCQSPTDSPLAVLIHTWIERHGYRGYLDVLSRQPGSVQSAIDRSIDEACAFVPVVSDDYIERASHQNAAGQPVQWWIPYEIDRALSRRQRGGPPTLVPVTTLSGRPSIRPARVEPLLDAQGVAYDVQLPAAALDAVVSLLPSE